MVEIGSAQVSGVSYKSIGNPGLDINAFHVEIDTVYNQGNYGQVVDPVYGNHIAVTLDGNPDTHYLYASVPTIEDQQWHEVTIEVTGSVVVVTLDGSEVINGEVEGLTFRGGYIGFSGVTGLYTNWHRFDNLQILDECIVP